MAPNPMDGILCENFDIHCLLPKSAHLASYPPLSMSGGHNLLDLLGSRTVVWGARRRGFAVSGRSLDRIIKIPDDRVLRSVINVLCTRGGFVQFEVEPKNSDERIITTYGKKPHELKQVNRLAGIAGLVESLII